MNSQAKHEQQDDRQMQALVSAALQAGRGDAPPADLVERIVAVTAPRLGRSRLVIGRVGVAAGWWAAAACVVMAVGLGSQWMRDRETPTLAWSSADEMRIAQLAEADVPREGVEVELRALALAVQNAKDSGRENWDGEEIGERWTQSEAEIGVF